jgi:hypothetical protein
MIIKGLTRRQVEIADQLWACETLDDADEVVARYGTDGVVVHSLMVAEVLDYTDVDLTEVKTWLNDTFWLN